MNDKVKRVNRKIKKKIFFSHSPGSADFNQNKRPKFSLFTNVKILAVFGCSEQ